MASRTETRRPRRWGAGVELTARDAAALRWLADQYAVRADLLGLLRGQQRASWWLPDGALPAGGDAPEGGPRPLHTIEVELTPKHLARLQQVFEDRYPGEVQTTYFTPPAHVDGLRRRLAVLEQATWARNEPWSRVTVVPLPALPGVSYEGAA
jgi:hypothetical protein